MLALEIIVHTLFTKEMRLVMKLLFFDTETTGINPGSICQLSYIVVDTTCKPQNTWGKNFFFTVDYVEPEAEKVHGFSVEKLYELSSGEGFEDRFQEILQDFSEADVLIGHNVNFDIKFLTYELEGCGELFSPKNIFCTMNYYRNIIKLPTEKGYYKSPRLEEAVKFLNINEDTVVENSIKLFGDYGEYHDARFDTTATYLLVVEGIKKGHIPGGYFSKKVNKSAK